ncbi:MAG TPA: hypothetical protein VKS21_12405, partial [Spirochaetota bacterium]|nr:hypothetical protein [Spirochaetota bacterium]
DINKMLEVTKKLARKFAATVGSVAQPETQQQRIRVNKKRSSSLSVSGSSPSDNGSKVIRALLFTAGMGTLAGSGICFGLAAKAWDTHKTTDDFLEAEDAYNRTQTLDTVKVILGASGGTLLTGWLIAKLSSRKTATALRRVPMDRLTLTLAGQKIGINYRQRF